MTAYIVIAVLLALVGVFLLCLEISDWRHQREPEVLGEQEATENLYPLGNVDLKENGSR